MFHFLKGISGYKSFISLRAEAHGCTFKSRAENGRAKCVLTSCGFHLFSWWHNSCADKDFWMLHREAESPINWTWQTAKVEEILDTVHWSYMKEKNNIFIHTKCCILWTSLTWNQMPDFEAGIQWTTDIQDWRTCVVLESTFQCSLLKWQMELITLFIHSFILQWGSYV